MVSARRVMFPPHSCSLAARYCASNTARAFLKSSPDRTPRPVRRPGKTPRSPGRTDDRLDRPHFGRQISRQHGTAPMKNDHAFRKIPQLAHIAGPCVSQKPLQRFRRIERRPAGVHGAQSCGEGVEQQPDVVPTFAQRRQVQRKYAQPVIQVLAGTSRRRWRPQDSCWWPRSPEHPP